MMSRHGHSAHMRTSTKPTLSRGRYYAYATCSTCGKNGSISSTDGTNWKFSQINDCGIVSVMPSTTVAKEQSSALAVECSICSDDTVSFVSCAAGHNVCGRCFQKVTHNFNFTDRQKCLALKNMEAPDLHSWPFMCYQCIQDNISNVYPIGPCMSPMSPDNIRILFETLRKFKIDEGDDKKEVCDPSEVAKVRSMVSLFFEPHRCPECLTPFYHDGGCMSMKCRGRPGIICQATFCLWCLRVPNSVKLLGPNASAQDRGHACHRHIFDCPMAPPASSVPGKSCLYPTEDMEKSEWIVAWHHLQSIHKALKFLREFVPPNTAAAVMADPGVAKNFADAADCVYDRVKQFPQDGNLLTVPTMTLDLDTNEKFQVEDDDSSSDEDFIIAPPRVRPAGQPRGPVAFPPPAARSPPPERRPQLWNRFELDVEFIMEACNCNRRQATDALFANNRDPQQAVAYLLEMLE